MRAVCQGRRRARMRCSRCEIYERAADRCHWAGGVRLQMASAAVECSVAFGSCLPGFRPYPRHFSAFPCLRFRQRPLPRYRLPWPPPSHPGQPRGCVHALCALAQANPAAQAGAALPRYRPAYALRLPRTHMSRQRATTNSTAGGRDFLAAMPGSGGSRATRMQKSASAPDPARKTYLQTTTAPACEPSPPDILYNTRRHGLHSLARPKHIIHTRACDMQPYLRRDPRPCPCPGRVSGHPAPGQRRRVPRR